MIQKIKNFLEEWGWVVGGVTIVLIIIGYFLFRKKDKDTSPTVVSSPQEEDDDKKQEDDDDEEQEDDDDKKQEDDDDKKQEDDDDKGQEDDDDEEQEDDDDEEQEDDDDEEQEDDKKRRANLDLSRAKLAQSWEDIEVDWSGRSIQSSDFAKDIVSSLQDGQLEEGFENKEEKNIDMFGDIFNQGDCASLFPDETIRKNYVDFSSKTNKYCIKKSQWSTTPEDELIEWKGFKIPPYIDKCRFIDEDTDPENILKSLAFNLKIFLDFIKNQINLEGIDDEDLISEWKYHKDINNTAAIFDFVRLIYSSRNYEECCSTENKERLKKSGDNIHSARCYISKIGNIIYNFFQDPTKENYDEVFKILLAELRNVDDLRNTPYFKKFYKEYGDICVRSGPPDCIGKFLNMEEGDFPDDVNSLTLMMAITKETIMETMRARNPSESGRDAIQSLNTMRDILISVYSNEDYYTQLTDGYLPTYYSFNQGIKQSQVGNFGLRNQLQAPASLMNSLEWQIDPAAAAMRKRMQEERERELKPTRAPMVRPGKTSNAR